MNVFNSLLSKELKWGKCWTKGAAQILLKNVTSKPNFIYNIKTFCNRGCSSLFLP